MHLRNLIAREEIKERGAYWEEGLRQWKERKKEVEYLSPIRRKLLRIYSVQTMQLGKGSKESTQKVQEWTATKNN
jgi:hypothetical protein